MIDKLEIQQLGNSADFQKSLNDISEKINELIEVINYLVEKEVDRNAGLGF